MRWRQKGLFVSSQTSCLWPAPCSISRKSTWQLARVIYHCFDSVKMLRCLVAEFFGAIFAIGPLFYTLFLIIAKGWKKVTTIRDRPLPPDTFEDKRWGEHKFIRIPNLRIHYVEKGDHDKPLMVFLHGFPEFWFSWRYQLEHFSTNYWCVAPDLRGYGDTDKPTGIDQYTTDKLADDIKNLVKALGRDKCILWGHDWGGIVGHVVALRHPDIVQAYIACNISHPGAFEKARQASWKQKLMSWYMVFFQCPSIPETLLRLVDLMAFDTIFSDFKHKERVDPEAIEAYKFCYRDRNSFKAPLNYYRAAFQIPPTGKLAIKTKVPVLNIFGTGDKYIDVKTSQLSAEFVEDYTERLLDGVCHWSMMDDAPGVNRAAEQYLKFKTL